MEETLAEILECKFHVATRWLHLSQRGFTIPDYVENQGIKHVIIYGITDFTISLLDEYRITQKLNVIKAISDKKISGGEIFYYYDIPCVSPEYLPEYEDQNTMVIVTPMGWHKEIKHELKNYGLKHVVSIQEVIYDMCFDMEKNK